MVERSLFASGEAVEAGASETLLRALRKASAPMCLAMNSSSRTALSSSSKARMSAGGSASALPRAGRPWRSDCDGVEESAGGCSASVAGEAQGFFVSQESFCPSIEAHKFNLMRKLDIHNKAQLVQYAIHKKVIRLSETVPV